VYIKCLLFKPVEYPGTKFLKLSQLTTLRGISDEIPHPYMEGIGCYEYGRINICDVDN